MRDAARYVFTPAVLKNSNVTGTVSKNAKDKTKTYEKLDPVKIEAIRCE